MIREHLEAKKDDAVTRSGNLARRATARAQARERQMAQ